MMLLSDFLTLEHYFGYEQATQDIDDLLKRYGQKTIFKALQSGDLSCERSCFGKASPYKQKIWLSDQGRAKALAC